MAAVRLDELDFGKLDMLDVRGTAVELFTAGSGAPLLYLHGMDGIEGAAPLLRELAKSFTVYAPSHPGFGASALPKGMNRADDLGYFYIDLLDALGLDRPAVAASSFGGWVALELLTKEPARASSLVLAAPLGLRTANRREQYVADIFTMSRQDLAKRLQASEPSEASNIFKMPEDRLRRTMRGDEALSLYGWTPYMHNPKLALRLHRINCPTLVLWGSVDALVTPAYRDAFAAALPQTAHEEVAGAGHLIHADQPAALAARIATHAAASAAAPVAA